MRWLFNRDGSLSVLRVGLVVTLLGLLIAGAGGVSFVWEQASRRSPLEVAPYPGAISWGERVYAPTSRSLYFQVRDATPEQVRDHYQALLDRFGNSVQPTCIREPRAGTFGDYRPRSGLMAYRFICVFDRGGGQVTRVEFQPGEWSADPAQNTEGMTVVRHDQQWLP